MVPPTALGTIDGSTRSIETHSSGAVVNRGNAITEGVHQLLIHISEERSAGNHQHCMYMRLPGGESLVQVLLQAFLEGIDFEDVTLIDATRQNSSNGFMEELLL